MKIINPLNRPCFIDTLESLENEYKNDESKEIVILNICTVSKTYDFSYFKNKYPDYKIIAFNQEPLLATQNDFMHKKFYKFLKEADEVWDYDERQVKLIKNINKNTKLHTLKPYKDWSIYEPVEKDIDILFYGSLNKHRLDVLNSLKQKYKIHIITGYNALYAEDLDKLILRSKILLNIHFYYECSMQEQARMIRWIGAPCRIISEKSFKNYLGVEELNYEELFNI